MVRLWLYVNNGVSKKDLYVSFFRGKKAFKKIDYRIFTGEIDTVECWLEELMEQNFFGQGLERPEIQNWIQEMDAKNQEKRIPYPEIKPVLQFVEHTTGIHPTRLLKQSLSRYESGNLRTVSSRILEQALYVKKEVEQRLDTNQTIDRDKFREGVYGKRPGFIPFYEIEDQLEFLRKQGGQYPKKYLGRGIGYYQKKKVKRIASWRAIKIFNDCRELIKLKPELPISSLPLVFIRQEFGRLFSVLKQISIQSVCEKNDVEFEAKILNQVALNREKSLYPNQGLIRFDEAARYLKMKPRAFDYLVANHSELFKKIVVRKEKGWYIPDIYLEAFKKVAGFPLIKGKYDFLVSRKIECESLPARVIF